MPDTPLDYETNAPKSPDTAKRLLAQGLTILGISALLISFLLPTPRTGQVICAGNLRQIGQAILLYCDEGDGHYPPDCATVLRTQQISGHPFVCPSSGDSAASSPAEFGQPGHCSYVYVGSDFTWTKALPPAGDRVVAFDDPGHHGMEGSYILYDDGHVDWTLLPEFVTALNDLAAGHNPPRSKTTMTQSQAEKEYQTKWQPRMPQLKTSGWKLPSPATQSSQ